MRTEQCYCVLEAVKTGSFTKAAENLYLKQPSLRANIDKLEAELGQPLFNRSKSGVTLTAYGEWCYPHILNVVQTYETMKKKIMVDAEDDQPLLVGATRVFEGILGKSYNLYETQNNGNKCVFYSAVLNEEIVKKVTEHQLDVGLLSYFEVLWKEDKWIHTQVGRSFDIFDLCDIRLVALMRKDHPLARMELLDLEKIKKYLLCFFNYSGTYVLDVINHEMEHERDKLHVSRVADWNLLYKYLIEENAISFTLENAVSSYPDSLACVPMDDRFVQKAIAICPQGEATEKVFNYISIVKTLMQ